MDTFQHLLWVLGESGFLSIEVRGNHAVYMPKLIPLDPLRSNWHIFSSDYDSLYWKDKEDSTCLGVTANPSIRTELQAGQWAYSSELAMVPVA